MLWLRLYHSCLDNPKTGTLNATEFGYWVRMLLLASSNRGDRGVLPPVPILRRYLHPDKPSRLDELLSRFVSNGLLDSLPDGRLKMHDWDTFQPDSDDSKPRVDRYRSLDQKQTPPGHHPDTKQPGGDALSTPLLQGLDLQDNVTPFRRDKRKREERKNKESRSAVSRSPDWWREFVEFADAEFRRVKGAGISAIPKTSLPIISGMLRSSGVGLGEAKGALLRMLACREHWVLAQDNPLLYFARSLSRWIAEDVAEAERQAARAERVRLDEAWVWANDF